VVLAEGNDKSPPKTIIIQREVSFFLTAVLFQALMDAIFYRKTQRKAAQGFT